MVYQGSKAKLRQYIVPILQKCIDENNVIHYIEPFVGGANVIDHIKCENKDGSDLNSYLIDLLIYMQTDPDLTLAPEECPFELYSKVRDDYNSYFHKYSRPYTALIGYFASYGGRFFDGGYGRDSKGGRSIYTERLKNAREQAPLLIDTYFSWKHYLDWSTENLNNCVLYLDPPYKNTKNYSRFKIDDYNIFYDFCRKMAKKNYVFISEYQMPEDFTCIWQKERKVMQKSDREKADIATEKLYYISEL